VADYSGFLFFDDFVRFFTVVVGLELAVALLFGKVFVEGGLLLLL